MPVAVLALRCAARNAMAWVIAAATGVLMMNTPALAATPQQQLVLDHLGAAFGAKAAELNILPLVPRDLPEGAAEFYVEAQGSHGHDNHNCIVMGDRVYCSGAEGEFERLLREQALLKRQDLGAAQFMRLYSLFALPRQLKYVDANVLARNPQDWRAYPEADPPTLSRHADGGVTLVFLATPVREVKPSRWTVKISSTGQVEVASTPLAAR